MIEASPPKNPDEPVDLDSCDWLLIQVFLREAEAFLKEPAFKLKSNTTNN